MNTGLGINHIQRFHIQLPLVALLSFHVFLVSASPGVAQEKTITQSMLALKVDLNLGGTTVGEAMREIARQTRLKARVADYLKTRRLTLHMRGVSAGYALDAIAELNGWEWYSPGAGEVLLTRPRPKEVRKIADVVPALQAALPLDLRRFIGLGLKDEDLPPPHKSKSASTPLKKQRSRQNCSPTESDGVWTSRQPNIRNLWFRR